MSRGRRSGSPLISPCSVGPRRATPSTNSHASVFGGSVAVALPPPPDARRGDVAMLMVLGVCCWCRRVDLPGPRGALAGHRRAPGVGPGTDRLRRHRRHLARRRRRRRGRPDGRRRRWVRPAVRRARGHPARRPDPPAQAVARASTSSVPWPTSSPCASSLPRSTWPPSPGRGSARRSSPRPTRCGCAS